MKQPRNAKARQAEAFGYASPAQADAEDDALRAEFAGLDLTDAEQADLAEAWRLRRPRAANAERIASRNLFAAVRASLRAALEATLRAETDPPDAGLALARFDEAEQLLRHKLSLALRRDPADDELLAKIAELDASRADRRRDAVADVRQPGKVSTLPRSGALRIHGRDGLAQLHEIGRLDRRQLDAGLAYRRRFEAMSHGLRSSLGLHGFGGVQDSARIAARAALWEAQRLRVEVAVMRGPGREDRRALLLLRSVAGEARSLTSIVGSGRANAAAALVLAAALDVAARMLPSSE